MNYADVELHLIVWEKRNFGRRDRHRNYVIVAPVPDSKAYRRPSDDISCVFFLKKRFLIFNL